jgi:hypothetical protein
MLSPESTEMVYRQQADLRKAIQRETDKVFQNGAVVADLAKSLATCMAQLDLSIQAGGPLPKAWHIALRPRCATCNLPLEEGRLGGSHRGCQ